MSADRDPLEAPAPASPQAETRNQRATRWAQALADGLNRAPATEPQKAAPETHKQYAQRQAQAMVDALNRATAEQPEAAVPQMPPAPGAFDLEATNDRRMEVAIAGLRKLSADKQPIVGWAAIGAHLKAVGEKQRKASSDK